MKNKILKGLALAGLVLSLGACNKTNDDTIEYTLKVYDLDNKLLVEDKIKEKNDTTLYDSLIKNTAIDVKISDSSFGHYIDAINNSISDPNYSLMIYENNTLSNSGVDYLKLNAGDEIVIKNECWNTIKSGYGTFDDTDVLVDKIIYQYSRNALHSFISKDETYNSSNYWNYMLINIANDNLYDSNIFNAKDYASKALKDSLVIDDNMTIDRWGKYYYTAKALGVSLDTFKPKYAEFINGIQTDYSAAEYSLPFGITMAKTLNITSANLEELVNTTYRCSTDWGIDALMWQLTALSAFDKVTKEDLNTISISLEKSAIYDINYNVIGEHTNAISTALKLLPFAALGENPRTKKNSSNKDLVELLIEEFYDSKTGYFKLYGDDEKASDDNIFINQIYVSLMAYKITRDLNKKVNIFA